MERILTSWKEIAEYLGKGVRTVQRWEHQLGLPIRRPDQQESNIVLATTTDLDNWVYAGKRTSSDIAAENESLRQRVQLLEVQYAKLLELLNAILERIPSEKRQINYAAQPSGEVRPNPQAA